MSHEQHESNPLVVATAIATIVNQLRCQIPLAPEDPSGGVKFVPCPNEKCKPCRITVALADLWLTDSDTYGTDLDEWPYRAVKSLALRQLEAVMSIMTDKTVTQAKGRG